MVDVGNVNVTQAAMEDIEDGLRVEAHILESMKMEFTVTAPSAGMVKMIFCKKGLLVASGQTWS